MLHLAVATDRAWVDRVLPHLDELLVEQAHLEKKAASSAVTFLFRYQEHASLLEPLSALAREELEHFELVLRELRRRGIPYGRQRPSPYPARLLAVVRDVEPQRLLDMLLCNALIEARSCERMRILGDALRGRDDELADMYRGLVRSEARHHDLYQQLAKGIFDAKVVDARLAEIAAHEASVVEASTEMPRLHD